VSTLKENLVFGNIQFDYLEITAKDGIFWRMVVSMITANHLYWNGQPMRRWRIIIDQVTSIVIYSFTRPQDHTFMNESYHGCFGLCKDTNITELYRL
jgi:hypothetical protein